MLWDILTLEKIKTQSVNTSWVKSLKLIQLKLAELALIPTIREFSTDKKETSSEMRLS